MANPVEALDFLARPQKYPARPVCVVFGGEHFLQRQVIAELRRQVLGEAEGEFSFTALAGEKAQLRDVTDELATVALFGGGKRMVVIEDADPFVTAFRSGLETYAAKPRTSAVLVLAVGTWASNTRLYKELAESGLQIECKTPSEARLLKWMVDWAKRQYGAELETAAAEMLIESVEPDLGLFDQELAKLAALAGATPITATMVRQAVGGWRTQTAWDMIDAAAAGNAAAALAQLDHLLIAGEAPIGILAQLGFTLRRFCAATRLIEDAEARGRKISPRQALQEVGVKSFGIAKSESQLLQLGRVRAGKFYASLLEADLALKGTSSSPERGRLVLEQLIARMAAPSRRPQTSRSS